MNKRLSYLVLLALLANLFTGTVVSGAQSPLTETYTWEARGLSVRYPGDWLVEQKDAVISLRPTSRDVSDGRGPELVLFDMPGTRADQLDAALTSVAAGSGATNDAAISGQLGGYSTRSASMSWADPAASGVLTLIALDDRTVIGVAYVVRDSDAAEFLPVLQQMAASLTFSRAALGAESSSDVTSVQLSQRFAWNQAGLVLFFPADWTVNLERQIDGEEFSAMPDDAQGDESYHLIQGAVLEDMEGVNLRVIAEATAEEYHLISDILDVTVAGQAGIVYEFLDDSVNPALHVRLLIVSLPNDHLALFVFGTRETVWDDFRPLVSAIISNIELAANRRSSANGETTTLARGADLSATRPVPLRQNNQYLWEEIGAGFTLPEGWQGVPGNGQDYDLALVSPDALAGDSGAFMMLTLFPGLTLGDTTLESALQPIAEQTGSAVESYTAAGIEGQAIFHEAEDEGAQRGFILIPYGARGDALYIQTTAPLDGDDPTADILASMTLTPPEPDYAAIDAAWQTSLAEQNRLIVGDPDAPIKVREYLSFTCGHCVRYSRSMERMIALDVETGRVQYEFAALAWNAEDVLANTAALATFCAAEQGKGFTASEALFQGDFELGADEAYSRDGINDLLGDLGLDMDTFNACLDDGKYASLIETNLADFYDHGLTGTPTITLGVGDEPVMPLVLPDGEVWSGAIPLFYLRDLFSAIIDDGLTVAEWFEQ
jgi:protein-disulfide isomerase